MPDSPMISVRDLLVAYGNRTILHGISLDVMPGETMVILGGSGSGKSTLLRHIIGLERPQSGQIFIKGVDIVHCSERELNEVRKSMGVSFQGSALFNSMTVADNVALPLREHTKLAESTIKLMTRIKLEQVGLASCEDYYPAQLSGGMKKRAAVARALAMDPEILLFDEPSAGLDPIIAAGIDELILELKRAFPHMSIVVVTHELASAFLIADRIAVVDKGRILIAGTKEEVRSSSNARVRQFLDRVPDPVNADQEAFLERLIE
ncbi:MAG TPA: ABC transporter ATP-binding protein [Bryobacterales bacterium]|nr:ABC transporter ATP-binding protein [Bryobacterales bacterium]